MNQAVRSWQRWQQRRKPDAIDTVEVDLDDEKVVLAMGQKVVLAFNPSHFNNLIRAIKTRPMDDAKAIRNATYLALKRLGAWRDKTKAVKGVPNGSDQLDLGTFYTWCDRLKPEDTEAVAQLVAIDATAVARVDG